MIKFTKIFLFTILAIFSLGFIANVVQAMSGSADVTVNVTTPPPTPGIWSIGDCPTIPGSIATTITATCSNNNCNPLYKPNDKYCSAVPSVPTPTPGTCNPLHYNCISPEPSSNNLDLSTFYWWACPGSNGGATTYCTEDKPALPVTNGSCASSHYNCKTGTSGYGSEYSTYYWWACSGSNGGSTDYCTENKTVVPVIPINGVCSTSHYNCDSGTPANKTDGSSSWIWSCMGSNGGGFDTCTESKPVVSCSSPTTQTVKVACDLNSNGDAVTSGMVTRSQTKT